MNWCDEAFGPVTMVDGERGHIFACRKTVGHFGPHSCEASRAQGWVDPNPEPQPPALDRESVERWLAS